MQLTINYSRIANLQWKNNCIRGGLASSVIKEIIMYVGCEIDITDKTYWIHNIQKFLIQTQFKRTGCSTESAFEQLYKIINKHRYKQTDNYKSYPELVHITVDDPNKCGLYIVYDRAMFKLYGKCVYINQGDEINAKKTEKAELQKRADEIQKQLQDGY